MRIAQGLADRDGSGYLIEEEGMTYLRDIAADTALTPLQAAYVVAPINASNANEASTTDVPGVVEEAPMFAI